MKISTVLNSISDAFYTVDFDWKITYWNKKAAILSGYSEKEVVGKSLWQLYPNSNWQKTYEKAMSKRETVAFDGFSDTWNIWCEVSVYPSESGLTVIIKDINERKKAEIRLNELNERLNLATEASNEAIWDWNIKEEHIQWNKAFYEYTGYSNDEVPKTFEGWVNLIHPSQRKGVLKSMINTLKNPHQLKWNQEYKFRKSNGKYVHILAKGKLLRDKSGKAVRMVGAIEDITERNKYQRHLESLNLQLKASNAELEQFAYVASHDLQEPLRMVTNFLTRLDKKYSDQLDQKAKKYIEFAVEGGERMKKMINDLLEYSRVGRHQDQLEEISVKDVVKEVLSLNRNRIERSSAKIVIGKLPKIRIYRSPLIQIFHNLVSNALKYKREGVPPVIKIHAKKVNGKTVFSVSDNGLGIDKDFHVKIFSIFQRLHLKDEFEGSGMGLAIVKKVVRNLGGEIWLESTLGVGSTFYFSIPKTINQIDSQDF